MATYDLTEIRKQKDPILRNVRIARSVQKGRVVIEASAGPAKLTWIVTKHQARMLADLLRDAAEEP